MSNARSPRDVCSITIGTTCCSSGLMLAPRYRKSTVWQTFQVFLLGRPDAFRRPRRSLGSFSLGCQSVQLELTGSLRGLGIVRNLWSVEGLAPPTALSIANGGKGSAVPNSSLARTGPKRL